jgi:hypothetical protein
MNDFALRYPCAMAILSIPLSWAALVSLFFVPFWALGLY